jgi:hypothetical protein
VSEQTLGYFTQKLGERIAYDGTGPRCPYHNCYMVIGDSAAIRRYVCPVGECDEVGPVVDTTPRLRNTESPTGAAIAKTLGVLRGESHPAAFLEVAFGYRP